jgi:hypothetical protein
MRANFDSEKIVRLSHEKIDSEIAKLIAETAMINSKHQFYPFLFGVAYALIIIAIVKLFL